MIEKVLLKAMEEVEGAYLRSPPHWSGRLNAFRALQLLRSALDLLGELKRAEGLHSGGHRGGIEREASQARGVLKEHGS
ncbi:hypothetical protein Igni_0851 [Ignicoccus hospitalis KIN4/I]|uniref:Uncharacterized protein n=1 Tax=Ignicoccus hospitalis (strain KIN4/I / DSM 18386 / JCM 14125) TaxID=453591 RepID=A8AAT1_IGNH4|nr:hypothetical protein Igni_0851 [Ignicoccus hospitalis KIN4/I]